MRHSSTPARAAAWALLALCAIAALLALSTPAAAGGPPEYLTGDITVASGPAQVWQNRTVVLSGNLTVEAGGHLTLSNSSLLLSLPANGSFSVTVQSGGSLDLLDLDGIAATAYDRSSIASATAGHRYTLMFAPGSGVLVRNSEVRDFGYNPAVPGMTIQSSNVTFTGATLGAYAFLKVEGASPHFTATLFEGGGQGSNYFYGSQAVLTGCTLSGHLVAVAALQGSDLVIDGALMRDLAFALAVNGSTVTGSNTTLSNASQGLYLTNGSLVLMTDLGLGGSPVSFGDNASELRASRSFTALVLNQAVEPVRQAAVEFRDGLGGVVASGTTGGDGRFGPVPLLAYSETAAGQTSALNYTLNATRGQNATEVAFSAATESGQLTVSINANLDPTVTLIRPAPGSVLLADVVATFEATAMDPDSTPGGLTVTWREETLGFLAQGGTSIISLPEGRWNLTVEVADADGGFRALPFTLEAVRPTVRSFSDGPLPANATFVVSMAPTGGFLVAPTVGTPLPALAVGRAFDIRPATGTVVWSNGTIMLSYEAADLPYGVNLTGLILFRFNGTAWVPVPASSHDALGRTVRAAVTPAAGLGSFVIAATTAAPVPPEVDEVPLITAVRGQPFSYPVRARDTPGQAISYALEGAPAWVSVGNDTGVISGTPGAGDRGFVNFTLTATDATQLATPVPISLFVTASAENTPPRLVNPVVLPAAPAAGGEVTVQVTYFDAQDDLPVVLEMLFDGEPMSMEPLDERDIFVDDGKTYVARVVVSDGRHNISFRTTDGAPGHADVFLDGPSFEAVSDPLRAVNNAFLALFVSAALTFAFIVYMGATRNAPEKPAKTAPDEPEDRIEFLEGAALGRIEPQPPSKPQKGEGEKDGEPGGATGPED